MSATSTNHFSLRRVLFCTLPLLGLALWILALGSLANAGGTATAESPARVSVQIPAAAKNANVVMLELGIAVMRKPASGQLGAVIRLRQADGGTVELGRVSIVGKDQSYQLNIGGAALNGSSADVEVALIDRGGGPAPPGAELSISRARIVTR